MTKAALSYLRRAAVPGRFSDAMEDLLIHEGTLPPGERLFDGRIIRLQYPPYPNTGRNKLVAHYLDTCAPDVDRLLMVDDDNPFLPWQARAICELLDPVVRPIVSGLYFAYDEDTQQARPIILRRAPVGGYATVWHYKRGLEPSDVVGMGFCGIHRSVLEQWRTQHGDTWFDYDTSPFGEFVIEDRAFCERMRAQGRPIYVHTGIKIGHMKLVDVNESAYVVPQSVHEEEFPSTVSYRQL